MAKVTKLLASLSLVSMVIIFAFVTWSCSEQTPLQPENTAFDFSLAKKGDGWQRSGLRSFDYTSKSQGYEGGAFFVADAATFHVEAGAIVPPKNIDNAETIAISMLVKKQPDRKRTHFVFGPHGCRFDPPAEVTLAWPYRESVNLKLYYIDDNGNYLEQAPEDIDINDDHITLKIHHFSEYVVDEE